MSVVQRQETSDSILGQTCFNTTKQPIYKTPDNLRIYISDLIHQGLPSVSFPNQELSTLSDLIKDQGYRGEVCRPYISELLLRKEDLAISQPTEIINNKIDVFLSHVILTPDFFSKLDLKEICKWLDCLEAHFSNLSKKDKYTAIDLTQLNHASSLLILICNSDKFEQIEQKLKIYNFNEAINQILNKFAKIDESYDVNTDTLDCLMKVLDLSGYIKDFIAVDALILVAKKYSEKFKEINRVSFIGENSEDYAEYDDYGEEEFLNDTDYSDEDINNIDFEADECIEDEIQYQDSEISDNELEEDTITLEKWSNLELRLYDLIIRHSARNEASDFWIEKISDNSIHTETYRIALDGLTTSKSQEIIRLIPEITYTAKTDQMACFNIVHLLLSSERLGLFCEIDFMHEISKSLNELTYRERTSIINRCKDVIDTFTGTDELPAPKLAEEKISELIKKLN
jgi:hypothetical protein